MSVCPFIFLVETAGKREEGNGQLAKSVKYLSGKRHRDEAALLLSMFTSMSEWEQDLERGTYTKCCVGVTRFLSLSLYTYIYLYLLLCRLCLALCAFLLCFSSVDHIVPLGPRSVASASFECWENSWPSASGERISISATATAPLHAPASAHSAAHNPLHSGS